jgi:phosphoglycolate phosphatase-like HAD superfamily hydrolase
MVYNKIPYIRPFEGINDLLNTLTGKVFLAIVTSSPSTYCQKVVKHNNWEIDKMVCYHDTKNHKPHPEPILKAMEKLDIEKDKVLSIGDEAKDIMASRKAGVISIAALWGTTDRGSLLQSKPDYFFETVDELTKYIMKHLDIT